MSKFLTTLFESNVFSTVMLFKNIQKILFKAKPIKLSQYSTKTETDFPRKVFSGIQPTGSVHLGNYSGAISQWVKLQDSEDMTLMIADLHSITLPYDSKNLSSNILELTATLLGCGINPSKVLLFQQSSVGAHSELNWFLGCISTMARLAHLPQFKEKSANLKNVPLGLYVYPVLQAADILAYKATHVPVGEDQAQHIELTQELARMFNKRYGLTFPPIKTLVTDYARLKNLRNPLKKMSKSDPDPKSRICLTDSIDEIAKKLKKATTDCISEVTYDPENRPGVANLINIHCFVTGKSPQVICQETKGLNTGQYKLIVSEVLTSYILPIQQKISDYLNDPDYLLRILEEGAEKANEISGKTVEEVKDKLGLKIKVKTKQKIGIQQS